MLYTVKYARGKNHIAGLDEVVTAASRMNYALTACSALSKSSYWCDGRTSEYLVEVLESARATRKGPCATCERKAVAAIAAQVGCTNSWHASAPARVSMACLEKACGLRQDSDLGVDPADVPVIAAAGREVTPLVRPGHGTTLATVAREIMGRHVAATYPEALAFCADYLNLEQDGQHPNAEVTDLIKDRMHAVYADRETATLEDSHVVGTTRVDEPELRVLGLPCQIADQVAEPGTGRSVTVQVFDPAAPRQVIVGRGYTYRSTVDPSRVFVSAVPWTPAVKPGTVVDLIALRTNGSTCHIGAYIRR